MNTPTPEDIDRIVSQIGNISDRGAEGLIAWAKAFVAAHTRAPNGLTIEVGTRIGGSAILWAELLALLYSAGKRPPLWTVDPYGSKPYVGGDPHGVHPPIYDEEVYSIMKKNMVNCPFHTHWLMQSYEFFSRLDDMAYWRPGNETMKCEAPGGGFVDMPIGEKWFAGHRGRGGREGEIAELPPRGATYTPTGSASFILLDGEHSSDAIWSDLGLALPWLKPGGTVVVDNIDTDPATLPRIHVAVRNAPRDEFEFDAKNRWLLVHRPLL